MPFIEAKTIRGKLNGETQFGIEEAVRITTEVAGAPESADGQAVIHRDTMPEIILLQDGRAMVMDGRGVVVGRVLESAGARDWSWWRSSRST